MLYVQAWDGQSMKGQIDKLWMGICDMTVVGVVMEEI